MQVEKNTTIMENKKSILVTWSYLLGFAIVIIAPFGLLTWYLRSSTLDGYLSISLIFLGGILILALSSLIAWLAYLENQRLTNDEIGVLEAQIEKIKEEKRQLKEQMKKGTNSNDLEMLFTLLEKMRQNTEKNGPNTATESKIPEDVRAVALAVFEKIISNQNTEIKSVN